MAALNGLRSPTDLEMPPTTRLMPAPAAQTGANGLTSRNPYASQPQQKANGLLEGAVRGFRRGFDPEGFAASEDRAKAEGLEKGKKLLAMAQQQRQLPEQQRTQWAQQNVGQLAQLTGMDPAQFQIDPNDFTDQALDGHIAALAGQLGISPESPEFQIANHGAAGYSVFNPKTGTAETTQFEQDAEPQKLPEGMWYGPDGKGPPQPIPGYVGMRTQIAQGSQNAGGAASKFRPATKEEAAQYGAEAGQIDERSGRFYPSGGQNAGEYSASERKTYRDRAAALKTLDYLVEDYRKAVDKYGPQLVDAELGSGGFRKTDRAQELLAKHNNLMMFLKGPELFNLGVLTGPDVERLQRTLPEPVGAGTFGTNKETLSVGLDSLGQFTKYKMGLIPDQFRMQDGAAPPPSAPAAPGGLMGAVTRGVQQMQQRGQPQAGGDLDPEIERTITEAFGPDDMGDELPPGVTQEEWDNMDEQDRALFR